jgi:two-component system nitrate/nitrite response regulator NarL
VLTGSCSVRWLQKALAIGVAGYLRKDEQIDQMLAKLERCVHGEQVLDEVLMRRLDRSVLRRERNRTATIDFTTRQRAVADLLQEGLNTAEIVARLGISESTVRTHVQAILSKLSVHSRVQAVALFNGLPAYGDEAIS